MMARERKGDSTEGRKIYTFNMCYNKDNVCERKRVMAINKEGNLVEGSVCTLEMHYYRKEIKNAKEKVRAMVRERKRAFVEGRQHV
jgi:hypothetical protein